MQYFNIKFLCIVLILILKTTPSFASEGNMPPLPENKASESTIKSESTFTKLKSFLGFSKKEPPQKLEQNEVIDTLPNQEIEQINSVDPILEEDIENLSIPTGFLDDIAEDTMQNEMINKPDLPDLQQESAKDLVEDKTAPPSSETEKNKTQLETKEQINKEILEPTQPPRLPISEPSSDEQNITAPLTPNYENNISNERDSDEEINQYVQEYKENVENNENYVEISDGDIKKKPQEKVLSPEEIKEKIKNKRFISNESQVLLLPDDDVVLGRLTEEARLTQMDFRTYSKLFWKEYYRLSREKQRQVIEEFIDNYDENFN